MVDFSFAKRLLAALLAIALVAPGVATAQTAQQSVAQSSSTQEGPTAQSEQQSQPAPEAPLPQPADLSAQEIAEQANSAPQQSGTANPVGTAAAPSEKPVGVAGSEPAGAAIAPARQRRVRRILISIGAIVGAGVAVGTVAALSRSSSSRPH